MNQPDVVATFVAPLAPETAALVLALHALIGRAAPQLAPSLKWGQLTYHHAHNVCAIAVHARHVNLQVWRASELSDPADLLRGSGKQMRHIPFVPGDAIDEAAVTALVAAAAGLADA